MIQKISTKVLLFSMAIYMLASCSSYDKLLKSSDNQKKYDMALKYYEKKDYFRSLQLFDELVPVYRGTDKAEKIYYLYAYSYFGQENYLAATYHFKNFVATFPRSEHVEEAHYMSAYCYYMDSPEYNLDATNTIKAISELQSFINAYPKSTRVADCNKLIDELRAKLEMKAFENARLYYKTEEYKAAITSFNNVLKDYPDTKYREEAMALAFKASYHLAIKSVENKKDERLKAASAMYKDFVAKYPESKYMSELNSMYSVIEKEIKQRNITI